MRYVQYLFLSGSPCFLMARTKLHLGWKSAHKNLTPGCSQHIQVSFWAAHLAAILNPPNWAASCKTNSAHLLESLRKSTGLEKLASHSIFRYKNFGGNCINYFKTPQRLQHGHRILFYNLFYNWLYLEYLFSNLAFRKFGFLIIQLRLGKG